MEKKEQSRFEDWEDVDYCSKCQNWYNNSCDSLSELNRGHCKAFLPIRGVTLPQEIYSAQNGLNSLSRAFMILTIIMILLQTLNFGLFSYLGVFDWIWR